MKNAFASGTATPDLVDAVNALGVHTANLEQVPGTPGAQTARSQRSLPTDKGAVVSARKWLERHGVKP
jgi:hypothetical protein